MKLLVTGSRDASSLLFQYARAIIVRAKELGWSIVVGDAPGIDAEVIAACDMLGVPVEVHGGYNKLRHTSSSGQNITHPVSYPERDRLMAELCDICIGVWNGKSRGTMITVKAAAALGKTTHLYNKDHLEY